MSQISISSLLDGSNYFKVSRPLSTLFGLKEAIILPEIINAYRYLKKSNGLIELDGIPGWFYLTMEKIFKRTSLTVRQQRPIINKLIQLGVLKAKTHGQPSKRYFCIDKKVLAEFLSLANIDSKEDYLMSLFDDDYFVVNSAMAHFIGLNESIILSEVINKSNYFSDNKQSISINKTPGWFYLTSETIEQRTSLTKKQQLPLVQKLSNLGLIKTKKYGLSAKKYFYLDQQAIDAMFLKEKKEPPLCKPPNSNNVCRSDKREQATTKVDISNNVCRSDKREQARGYKRSRPIYKNNSPIYKEKKDIVPRSSRPSSKTLEPKTKYKLSEEQCAAVDWLKDKKINTQEDTLCYWAKKYDLPRLTAVYRQVKFEKSKNVGGRMNQLLRENGPVLQANIEECREFAQDFKDTNNWHELEIQDRYAILSHRGHQSELSFSLNPASFAQILIQKFKNTKGRY